MKNRKVLYLLSVTLLILTIVPLVATTFFLDYSLETTLNLGFNAGVGQTLYDSAENLKKLKQLDPEQEENYKSQFEKVQQLIQVYSESDLVKRQIEGSLKIYFWAGLLLAMGLALLVAFYLSGKINRTYQLVFNDLIKEKEKVTYLEEISSWQELAKMLAHEIKNPLTPIEVLVSSLSKSYLSKKNAEFQAQLEKTQMMVDEELSHLKAIVNKFSEFSRLPKVELSNTDLVEVISLTVETLRAQNPDTNIKLSVEIESVQAALDKTLFRQVLVNLIKNGIEANPGKPPQFNLNLSKEAESESVILVVSNDGAPIPREMAQRVFDPYVSTKKDKANMGLGLTIAKKTIVEHGGTIEYQEIGSMPSFIIRLPEVK